MSDAVMGSAAEKGGWLPAASDAESGVQVAVATSGFAQWIDRAIAWVCLFSLVPVLIAASVDADKVHLPWLISIAGGLTVVAALMPVFARRAAVFKALAAAYGVVLVDDPTSRRDQLTGGRLAQRVHLTATAADLALQHMNQITERIDRDRVAGRPAGTADRLAQILGADAPHVLCLFRVGWPTRTGKASPRRAAHQVVGPDA